MHRCFVAKLALVIASAVACAHAHAVVVCVDTTNELSQALTTARSDSVDNDIRIAAGTYSAPAGGFVYDPQPGDMSKSLKLSGGWSAVDNCTSQIFDSTLTKLSGGNARRGLTLHRGSGGLGELSLSRLSIVGAFTASDLPADGLGLALHVNAGGHSGPVTIEHVIVRDNTAVHGNSVVYVITDGVLRFRNNLIVDNQSIDGHFNVSISAHGTAYATGNTIARNKVVGVADSILGLYIDTPFNGVAYLVNNIIWDNGFGTAYFDYLADSDTLMVANAIGRMTGTPSAGSVPPLALDPQFKGATDYRLSPSSPLHDLGLSAPFGGQAIADLDGSARQIGLGTDIGAYESVYVPAAAPDALFKNAFE
jgi:hypothetical protein